MENEIRDHALLSRSLVKIRSVTIIYVLKILFVATLKYSLDWKLFYTIVEENVSL